MRRASSASSRCSPQAPSAPPPAQAVEPETVRIASDLARMGPFTALLFRPKGEGPFPAVVALHGCGGLLNGDGEIRTPRGGLGRAAGGGRLRRAAARQLHRARHARDLLGARPEDLSRRSCGGRRCCRAVAGEAAVRGCPPAGPDGLVARRHDGAVDGAARASCRGRSSRRRSASIRDAGRSPSSPTGIPACRSPCCWGRPTTGPRRGHARSWPSVRASGPSSIRMPTTASTRPIRPVRLRKGIGSLKKGEAHVGTNQAAREAAIAEVKRIFEAQFGVP